MLPASEPAASTFFSASHFIALQRPADAPGKGVELIKSAAKRAHPRASLRMGVGPAVLEIGPLVTCAPQISISEQQLCACPGKFKYCTIVLQ